MNTRLAVWQLRRAPSVTDDRRGRELRSAAGTLLWHAARYHALPRARHEHLIGYTSGCALCHRLATRVKLAIVPSSVRCLALGAEDYETIMSADW
jgi:hypothetical protein